MIYRTPVMMERGWTQFAKEHLQLGLTEEERQPFNLLKPDSRCPKCHAPVRAWQNIPIVSYLMLGGKCGSCKTPISIRYPLVELLTGILFAAVAWQYGWSWTTLGGLILTAVLIALTFIDIDTQYLPDQLTLPLIWLGLLFKFVAAELVLPFGPRCPRYGSRRFQIAGCTWRMVGCRNAAGVGFYVGIGRLGRCADYACCQKPAVRIWSESCHCWMGCVYGQ